MQKILFHLPLSVLRLESCVLSLVSSKSDYFHYLVWIAKSFNTNVLQHFHQEIMTTSITYSIANHYYMHYLQGNRQPIENLSKTLKTVDCILKTKIPMTTSSSQIGQVMPFSLFYYASNAPQTKKRRALSVTLTHSNKTEMAYQVMYPPMPQCSISPSPYIPIDPLNLR